VKRVAPKKVFTLHGFAADFAQTLRELGFDARALSEQEQLALPLVSAQSFISQNSGFKLKPRSAVVPGCDVSLRPGGFHQPTLDPSLQENRSLAIADPLPSSGAGGAGFVPAPSSLGFLRFAETCAAIGAVRGKLEKVRILSEYLQPLEGEPLARVTTWFTGHPFPPSRNKVLQLGGALIRDALLAVGALTPAALRQIYLKHSDAGETTFEVLSKNPASAPTLSLEAIHHLFEQLLAARGPLGKLPLLIDSLRRCTALEGKFLVKTFTGDLRIGLKEGLVEEAVAKAFDVSLEQVKRANLLVGDIGETARLAQQRALSSANLCPFRPAKFMLASPEETAAAIWERMTTSPRAQNPLPASPEGVRRGSGHSSHRRGTNREPRRRRPSRRHSRVA